MMEGTKNTAVAFWVVCGMIAIAAFSRVLPHLPNFTPVAAMALFGGTWLKDRKWAYAVPLLALALSDVILSFLHGYMLLTPGRVFIYGSFVLITFFGTRMTGRAGALRVASYGLLSSVSFFLITNLGVWLTSGMYSKDIAGFLLCFELAIPFFRNTLMGDAFFLTVLFGVFGLARQRIPALARA